MFKKFLIIIEIVFLSACTSLQSSDDKDTEGSIITHTSNQYEQIIHKNLLTSYNDWKGTRYRLGGESKKGIDCSAFTQTVFLDSLGINLPRSTTGQKKIGIKISKSELKKGDLVFFRKNRHVGIYIGNGQFMHASSSQGVTISSLDETYWMRTYTQSRRVL